MLKKYTFLLLFMNASCNSQEVNIEYPKAPKIKATNIYFSETVYDPYQVLEDENNRDVNTWYQQQSELAENKLAQISGRSAMLERLIEYDNRITEAIIDHKITIDGQYFYLKRGVNDNIASLYYKNYYGGEETLLYDPKKFNLSIDNNSISYFNPSWDGSRVVVAITNSGKEISDLIVINVSDKTVLPEIVYGARPDSFLGVSWLPDNSGYTFLQFSNEELTPNYSVLYRVGQPVEYTKRVFGPGINRNINIDSTGVYPIVKILDQNDSYAIGYVATVDNFWEVYITDMNDFANGNPNWELFYSKNDQVFTNSGLFNDTSFVFKSNKERESNALYKVDAETNAFSKARLLCLPPDGEILQDFIIKGRDIFYTANKNGVSTSLYKCQNGESTKITLPNNAGAISLRDDTSDSKGFFVSLSGWTVKNQRFNYNIESGVFTLKPLSTAATYPEFKDVISKEVEISSHDGVLVPLSIIYNKNLELNNAHPTLFYGYGSYGTSIEPFYSTTFLHWVEMGGILCVPHVRGGGEKGEQWHQDGMMNNKENSWKDLIISAEYMIEKGFTSSDKIAIYSSSAGGIMIGKAITDRPDLFAVGIAEVPIMNPFRSEARKGGGGSNVLEYGTIKDSIQMKGLIKMDPYLSLEKNTEYPALLLTAGENDPRVPKWMPGKFVARAQEYSSSSQPILFRIDKNSGHGTVNEKIKYYQEYADVFSFAFWQTGHKGFILKE